MIFTPYGTQTQIVRLLLPFLIFYLPSVILMLALDGRKREQTQEPGLPRLLMILFYGFLVTLLLHGGCLFILLLSDKFRTFTFPRALAAGTFWLWTLAGGVLCGAGFGHWLSRKLRLD